MCSSAYTVDAKTLQLVDYLIEEITNYLGMYEAKLEF